MTNNKLTDERLTEIIKSAEAVITALAGTNDDVHPNNSTEMCRLYDWLNDNDAPPEVVLAMAKELQERRKADSEKIAITVTTEQRRVIEMLLNVCGAAFELADDSCQQDVDGEECHVVPDDSFKTLARALDEIENTLPTEDADRPDVFLAWAAMPRAVLKSLLHATPQPAPDSEARATLKRLAVILHGSEVDLNLLTVTAQSLMARCKAANSPVDPDGWVMVPMRLTAENGAKGLLSGEFSETKFINCPECFGDDECETCDGSGRIEITVPVTWTTIKEIWAKGIEHFAAAPKQENVCHSMG